MGGGLAGHESTRAYFPIPLPCLLGMTGQPKLPLTVASNWLLVLLGAGRAICKPPSQKKKKRRTLRRGCRAAFCCCRGQGTQRGSSGGRRIGKDSSPLTIRWRDEK